MVDVAEFLNSVFQPVRYLFFHLLRRGSGVRRNDHSLLNSELRVFQPTKLSKSNQATN